MRYPSNVLRRFRKPLRQFLRIGREDRFRPIERALPLRSAMGAETMHVVAIDDAPDSLGQRIERGRAPLQKLVAFP